MCVLNFAYRSVSVASAIIVKNLPTPGRNPPTATYPLPSGPLVVEGDGNLVRPQAESEGTLLGNQIAGIVALGTVTLTEDPNAE